MTGLIKSQFQNWASTRTEFLPRRTKYDIMPGDLSGQVRASSLKIEKKQSAAALSIQPWTVLTRK
jgi:hypothetical protein